MIEELGSYDPEVPLTDARCKLNNERVQYWLGVGAQPSDRVKVLIKKYGPGGTHLKEHEAAVAQLKAPKTVPDPGAPVFVPKPKKQAEEAGRGGARSERRSQPRRGNGSGGGVKIVLECRVQSAE